MTFPPGPPAGPPGPGGQRPPAWDPRAASQPFNFPGSVPGSPYPAGPGPVGPPGQGPFGQGGPGPMSSGMPGSGQPPGPQGWASGPPGVQPPVRPSSRWVVPLRISALVLVALGLSIPFDSSSDWVSRTTWAIFAVLAAATQLAASGGSSFGWDVRRSWLVGAVATAALTLHWLLIALPSVGSNAGFCLTFGTAAAVGALLLAPGRRW